MNGISKDNGAGSRPSPEPARKGGFANIEGYLALLLTFAFVLAPFGMRGPRGGEFVEGPFLLALWIGSLLFGISGARRGRGGARTAAVSALTILAIHAACILTIAYH